MVASIGASAVIVGGGVGGLSAAIDLATMGAQVTVIERSDAVGGKVRVARVGDRDIDVGPTVLTMRWAFDELFARANRSFDDYVTLDAAKVIARHAWSAGRVLDLHADPEKSRAAIAHAFGEREADGFERFCADTRRIYETVEKPFLRSERPTMGSLLTRSPSIGLGALAKIDAHQSMWRALGRYFKAPELRQLFGRYATYCGSSPFEAPATLNLIAHVEAQGVWRVRGGMVQLARALEKLARELGVEIVTNSHVERVVIEGGRVTAVHAGQRSFRADAVIVNGDVSSVRTLLGGNGRAPATIAPKARSLSAMTWAAVGRAEGFALVHHNVFFSDDYEAEFRSLFDERRFAERPSVYVCAQDRGDVDATLEQERFFSIVNAPATGDHEPWTNEDLRRWQEATCSTLARCGLSLRTSASEWATPRDYEARFPATGGALYGPAASGAFSSFSREGSRTKIAGLYLAGGSVHPGPGVPMASLSGQLAARSATADLALTKRSRPVATSGSTSTA
jgi:1-hydroxycarotenoid 3,4-desaturase